MCVYLSGHGTDCSQLSCVLLDVAAGDFVISEAFFIHAEWSLNLASEREKEIPEKFRVTHT